MNLKNILDRYVLRPILIASAIGLAGCEMKPLPMRDQSEYVGTGSIGLNYVGYTIIPDTLGNIERIESNDNMAGGLRSLHASGTCSGIDSLRTFTMSEDTRAVAKRVKMAQDTLRFLMDRDMTEQYNAKYCKH